MVSQVADFSKSRNFKDRTKMEHSSLFDSKVFRTLHISKKEIKLALRLHPSRKITGSMIMAFVSNMCKNTGRMPVPSNPIPHVRVLQ